MAERVLKTGAANLLDGSVLPETLARGRQITDQKTDRAEAVERRSQHSRDDGVQGRASGYPVFPNTKFNNA